MSEDQQNVYVVDDDDLARKTIVGILETEGFQAQAFASGPDLLDAIDAAPFGTILLDVKMPGMDGLETLARLTEKNVRMPIMMISGFGDISMAVRAVKAGAIDFIEKPFEPDELVAAIASSHENYAHGPVDPSADPFENTPVGVLSKRERQVLSLLINGDSNKVIAYKLNISPRTVEFHRAKIMKRLDVTTFAELVRVAVSSGL